MNAIALSINFNKRFPGSSRELDSTTATNDSLKLYFKIVICLMT